MSDEQVTIFDVETTGTNPGSDQIIEICIQHGCEGIGEAKTWRIKPSVEISPGAQAVHGISMSDLADCLSFADHAEEIRDEFKKSDIVVGYNIEFDLSFIQAEFRRVGVPELDLSSLMIVDPFLLWRKCEPRSLADAHQRFVGRPIIDAHSAASDVKATGNVLTGMIESFALTGKSWKEISELSAPRKRDWIGPSFHFKWKDKKAVFGFGKHRDRTLVEVANSKDEGYFAWLIKSDFPNHVKEIAEQAANCSEDELIAWLSQNYGQ